MVTPVTGLGFTVTSQNADTDVFSFERVVILTGVVVTVRAVISAVVSSLAETLMFKGTE